MRRLRVVLEFLIVALITILLISAGQWYTDLPSRIVIHFNASGYPNGWAERSVILWSLLPCIGVGQALVLRALSRWMEGSAARTPTSMNVPRNDLFLRISEPERRKALAPGALYLQWVAILLLLLFIYILEGVGATSIGRVDRWSAIPVYVVLAGILLPIPFLTRVTRKRIEASHAREHP